MKPLTKILTLAILPIVLLVSACAFVCYTPDIASLVSLLAFGLGTGLGTGFSMRDASLKVTKALPTAAAGSTATDGIDTGKGANGAQLADVEFLLTIPDLTTTMLPDTKTATFIIEHDTDSAFGTVATLNVGSVTQTGAGAAGATGTTFRFRLPSDANRYIRAKCTLGAGTTNSAAVSMTLEALT